MLLSGGSGESGSGADSEAVLRQCNIAGQLLDESLTYNTCKAPTNKTLVSQKMS